LHDHDEREDVALSRHAVRALRAAHDLLVTPESIKLRTGTGGNTAVDEHLLRRWVKDLQALDTVPGAEPQRLSDCAPSTRAKRGASDMHTQASLAALWQIKQSAVSITLGTVTTQGSVVTLPR